MTAGIIAYTNSLSSLSIPAQLLVSSSHLDNNIDLRYRKNITSKSNLTFLYSRLSTLLIEEPGGEDLGSIDGWRLCLSDFLSVLSAFYGFSGSSSPVISCDSAVWWLLPVRETASIRRLERTMLVSPLLEWRKDNLLVDSLCRSATTISRLCKIAAMKRKIEHMPNMTVIGKAFTCKATFIR